MAAMRPSGRRWLGSPVSFNTFVKPAFRIVGFLLRIPTGEDSSQCLGILEVLGDDHAGIRVMLNVFTQEQLIFEDVTNQCSQEKNVRSRSQPHPAIAAS